MHIPPREFLEGSLIDEVDDSLRCSTLVLDVAHPALDLVGMSQDLFLIGKILLLLKERALIGATSRILALHTIILRLTKIRSLGSCISGMSNTERERNRDLASVTNVRLGARHFPAGSPAGSHSPRGPRRGRPR